MATPISSSNVGVAESSLFRRMVAAVCVCNCAHFYTICSLFSYGGILAADLSWAIDRDHAGTIAGYLQSANVIGRVPTSLLWGYFGDRFGLRSALIVGMLSLFVGCLLFGLCKSAAVAILVRFVFLGMGNSWVTIFPAISMEIGGPEKQTAVVGMILGTGAVVQLLGPAIGGWTYSMIEAQPALVPNLAGAALCLFALATTLLWLPQQQQQQQCRFDGAPTLDGNVEACSDKAGEEEKDEGQDVEMVELSPIATRADRPGFVAVVCRRPVPLLIWMRAACGFLNFAFFEVVPLWAISSRQLGGLQLDQDILGTMFAVSALLSGFFMIFCLQKVTENYGLRKCSLVANFGNAILFATMPLVSSIWILTGIHAIMNSFMGTTEASYIAFVNNSVDADSRARVNGVCAMFESIGKAFGPFSMAVLFSWSLEAWGFAGHFMVFLVLASLHLSLVFATFCLPDMETYSKEKCDEDNEFASGCHPRPANVLGRRHEFRDDVAADASCEVDEAFEGRAAVVEGESSPLRPPNQEQQ